MERWGRGGGAAEAPVDCGWLQGLWRVVDSDGWAGSQWRGPGVDKAHWPAPHQKKMGSMDGPPNPNLLCELCAFDQAATTDCTFRVLWYGRIIIPQLYL